MVKVAQILSFLEQYAPYELSENWDNCGLLVGDKNLAVNKVLIALDVTQAVIDEAICKNCKVIVAHHPVIFTKISKINADDYTGKMLITAIKNDISIICMHTNLDSANFGVNDALADKIGLKNIENLGCGDSKALGRFGNIEKPCDFDTFLCNIAEILNANGLKFVGNRKVSKVAVLGGAGGKLIDYAISNGCDTYVTSDCSYDTFQKAEQMGINLVDAGHFATENVICDILLTKLSENFDIIFEISENHKDVINFMIKP